MDIIRFLNHQRVIGRAPRTIARRAWSLGRFAEHLDQSGVTLTTATTGDVETFLARFPAAQSRYSIRSDIHQLYRHLRRTLPALTDPTDGLDPIKVPRRAASPVHADDVRRLLDELATRDSATRYVSGPSMPTGASSSPWSPSSSEPAQSSNCSASATASAISPSARGDSRSSQFRSSASSSSVAATSSGSSPASDRLIILLAAHAGLRVSEIARVRGEDADLARRWLTVTGKGGHVDVVPISATLAVELARHPRHGRLLAYRNGQAVSARIRRLFRQHGITGRPHDLRHSFGTEAAAVSNGNVVKVQQLMRHAEVATTMRYVRPAGDLHPVVDRLYSEAA